MKKEIGDSAAIEFSVAFYDALGAGERRRISAHRLACNAIAWKNLSDDQVPVLKHKPPAPQGEMSSVSRVSKSLGDLMSGDPDVDSIKRLINSRKSLLDGVPQYLHGDPIVEDVADFPVSNELHAGFTRLCFRPESHKSD